MSLEEILVRSPILLVLVSGLVLCVVRYRDTGAPAVLAGIGLAIGVGNLLVMPYLFRMLPDLLGWLTTGIISSCVYAIELGFLIAAVFARRTGSRHSDNADISGLSSHVDFAKEEAGAGATVGELEQSLASRGLSPSESEAVVLEVFAAAERKAGWRAILFGGTLAIVGTACTVISYLAAANQPGGGRYVVTYGLIFAGISMMIRGFIRVIK